MNIPADAFDWARGRDIGPGRLVTAADNWFLTVDRVDPRPHVRSALALTGNLIGSIVDLPADTHVLAIAPAFKWRPVLATVPARVTPAPAPGTLYLGLGGPFLRTWFQGVNIFAFDFAGIDITDTAPRSDFGVSQWAGALYLDATESTPICKLFSVDTDVHAVA